MSDRTATIRQVQRPDGGTEYIAEIFRLQDCTVVIYVADVCCR